MLYLIKKEHKVGLISYSFEMEKEKRDLYNISPLHNEQRLYKFSLNFFPTKTLLPHPQKWCKNMSSKSQIQPKRGFEYKGRIFSEISYEKIRLCNTYLYILRKKGKLCGRLHYKVTVIFFHLYFLCFSFCNVLCKLPLLFCIGNGRLILFLCFFL